MRRPLIVALAVVVSGCANTVYRVEGDDFTPEGPARTACEKREFLVLAPTRAEIAAPGKSTSQPRNGSGVYTVGGKDPQSITDLRDDGPSPVVERKEEELAPYDRSRYIASGLGAAGVVAIGIGTVLFISAFETKVSIDSATGSRKEEQTINGGKAAAGGIVVGAGFGLGIAGLIVNPSHAGE
jgi:hypothetical protein